MTTEELEHRVIGLESLIADSVFNDNIRRALRGMLDIIVQFESRVKGLEIEKQNFNVRIARLESCSTPKRYR